MEIIDGRNNGYPCISELPELDSFEKMTAPYPEWFMYILGDDICEGYPSLRYFADKGAYFSRSYTSYSDAADLYFGETPVLAAYYGSAEVYTKLKI